MPFTQILNLFTHDQFVETVKYVLLHFWKLFISPTAALIRQGGQDWFHLGWNLSFIVTRWLVYGFKELKDLFNQWAPSSLGYLCLWTRLVMSQAGLPSGWRKARVFINCRQQPFRLQQLCDSTLIYHFHLAFWLHQHKASSLLKITYYSRVPVKLGPLHSAVPGSFEEKKKKNVCFRSHWSLSCLAASLPYRGLVKYTSYRNTAL